MESLNAREQVFDAARKFYSENIGAGAKKPFVKGETYIPASGKVLDEDDLINLLDASLDLWLTAGRYADEFERTLAGFLGVKYCALVNSGSSANLIALSALTSHKLEERSLKPGDEVITVAAGFPTTVAPVIQNRLVPVFVDVNPGTYDIDVSQLETAVSAKTKAIFLAHTLGNPFEIEAVKEFAVRHKLWIIEDNCDALGSKYDGKFTGTFGHIATCSFYPAHHITMGEGGAVLTNDSELHEIILSFRDWGRDCWCPPGKDNTCGRRFNQQHGKLPFGYDHKYVYSHLGYNLKATDLQAAIGVSQLKKLPSFIEKRQHNFDLLKKGLQKFEDVLVLPEATIGSEPSWFGFPIIIRKEASFDRHLLTTYLEKHKIGTRLLFAGNILKQPAFSDANHVYRTGSDLENTDLIMERAFWIGVWPGISDEIIAYVINCFQEFLAKPSGA
jgi:CDP-6-deoxy-D-xylo-4-hexulose-3-dehydrase